MINLIIDYTPSLRILINALIAASCFTLSACASFTGKSSCEPEEQNMVTVLGYGTKAKYKNQADSEQIILAMRDAKEDAYRNLMERVGSVSLKYTSRQETKKDRGFDGSMVITFETSGRMRGARLIHLTPIGNDMYEAKLEANLSSALIADSATEKSFSTKQTTGLSKAEGDAKPSSDDKIPFFYLLDQ